LNDSCPETEKVDSSAIDFAFQGFYRFRAESLPGSLEKKKMINPAMAVIRPSRDSVGLPRTTNIIIHKVMMRNRSGVIG
jgi:hypothetical protein